MARLGGCQAGGSVVVANVFTDHEERAALLADAAAKLGVAEWVVEKDLWVCWLLARLHEIPGLPTLNFKGGTSLSKVHRLVERFSEDIDLTFSREDWGFIGDRDPLAEGISGKQRERLIEEVVARSVATVSDVIVPSLRAACIRNKLGGTVDVDPEDAQTVLFAFPGPVGRYGYSRPVVKAEFGARGDPWPVGRSTVRAYLDEVHPGVAEAATSEVTTLEPERTFWEKATLLHALHHGTLTKADKNVVRLSRHAYDLHRMWVRPKLRARLLSNRALLLAVVRNKSVFFKEGKARYDLVEAFVLNATPHMALETRLRADYAAMTEMFFPGTDVPPFDALLLTLRELDAAVGSWKKAT